MTDWSLLERTGGAVPGVSILDTSTLRSRLDPFPPFPDQPRRQHLASVLLSNSHRIELPTEAPSRDLQAQSSRRRIQRAQARFRDS